MSAPPRIARGGGSTRGRGGISTTPRTSGRGMNAVRGGRSSRGAAAASTNPKAESLLQGLQSGSLNHRPGASRRGSGKKNDPTHKA
jgi:hypothetical protein